MKRIFGIIGILLVVTITFGGCAGQSKEVVDETAVAKNVVNNQAQETASSSEDVDKKDNQYEGNETVEKTDVVDSTSILESPEGTAVLSQNTDNKETIVEEAINDEQEAITFGHDESFSGEVVKVIGNVKLTQDSLPLDIRPLDEIGYEGIYDRGAYSMKTVYYDSEGLVRFVIKDSFTGNSGAKVEAEFYNGSDSTITITEKDFYLNAGPDDLTSAYAVSIPSNQREIITLTSSVKANNLMYYIDDREKRVPLKFKEDKVTQMDDDHEWNTDTNNDTTVFVHASLSPFGNESFKFAITNHYISDINELGEFKSTEFNKFAVLETLFINITDEDIDIEGIYLFEEFGEEWTELSAYKDEELNYLVQEGFVSSKVKPSEKVTLYLPFYMYDGKFLMLGVKTSKGNIFIIEPGIIPIVRQ